VARFMLDVTNPDFWEQQPEGAPVSKGTVITFWGFAAEYYLPKNHHFFGAVLELLCAYDVVIGGELIFCGIGEMMKRDESAVEHWPDF